MTTRTSTKTRAAANGAAPKPQSARPGAQDPAITMLSIDVLVASPMNPRLDLGDLSELAASIGELGVLQALTVRPRTLADDGTYEIVIGHRRAAAARLAGIE